MKTYAISLRRATVRSTYIKGHLSARRLSFTCIDAIDGALLNADDLEQKCDLERVNAFPRWLTPGAIACALSHQLSYHSLLESGDRFAFIVEDDAHLPEDIEGLLDDIAAVAAEDEVILLYAASLEVGVLSRLSQPLITTAAKA